MTTYRVATSHNVALVSLTEFDPQPRCEGLLYTRSTPLGDRSTYHEGPYFPLVWDVIETPSDLTTLLTLCGLASAEKAAVTVYGPDRNYGWARYNATALRPLPGQEITRNNFFLRNFTILFVDLVAL